MSVVDDLKQKVDDLDHQGSGMVNYDELKAEADKHGLGGQLEAVKGDITDQNGNVSVDKAKQTIDGLGGQVGGELNDLKAKF